MGERPDPLACAPAGALPEEAGWKFIGPSDGGVLLFAAPLGTGPEWLDEVIRAVLSGDGTS
jgi:hypothetical protein